MPGSRRFLNPALAVSLLLMGVGTGCARFQEPASPAFIGHWTGTGKYKTLDFWDNGQWSVDTATYTTIGPWKRLSPDVVEVDKPGRHAMVNNRLQIPREKWRWSVNTDDRQLTVHLPDGSQQVFDRGEQVR